MRAPLLPVAVLLASCSAGCGKRSGDQRADLGSASAASEPGAADAPCAIVREQRLGDRVHAPAGLTSRRLSDGRLVVGLGLGNEPRAVVVDGKGDVSLLEPRRKGPTSGELLRVTPAVEGGEIVALGDVRSADGGVQCAAADSAGLSDCRSFASADGKTSWIVGSKAAPPKLVARRAGAEAERELFRSDGPPFEDLRSEHIGEHGFVVSARYGGKVVMIRLKPDLALMEARAHGGDFGENPDLISSGSGAMLLATRKAFGHQRLAFAQFADQRGNLPAHFDGSDHGLIGHAPRLATAGSQRFLTVLDALPGRLQLLPVDATLSRAGRGQFVTAADVKVAHSAAVGFDDGRVVVVYATAASALMAATLRCKVRK